MRTTIILRTISFLLLSGPFLTIHSDEMHWDVSSDSGYQGGTGIWSNDSYNASNWAPGTGMTQYPWQQNYDETYNTVFCGEITSGCTVFVEIQPQIDTISFTANKYTINGRNGGSIAFKSFGIIIVEDGVTATINSMLTGHNGIKKAGMGTIQLSSENQIADTIYISEGTIRIFNDQALGIKNTNTIIIGDGAVLDINGMNLQQYSSGISIFGGLNDTTGNLINSGKSQPYAIGRIILEDDALIGSDDNRFDIGRNITGSCIIGNHHTLRKVGSNEVVIAGTVDDIGLVEISEGTLLLEQTDALDTASVVIQKNGILASYNSISLPNNISVSGGKILHTFFPSSTTSKVTYSGTLAIKDSVFIENGVQSNTLFDGVISGDGKLVVNGNGRVILNGTSEFSGKTEIRKGSLQLGSDFSANASVFTGSIENNDSLIIYCNALVKYNGSLRGNGTIVKRGPDNLLLTGNNSFVGHIFIETGRLQVGDGKGGSIFNGDITSESAVIFSASDTIEYTGVIDGAAKVIVDGTGVVIFSSSHLYTEKIHVLNGMFVLNGEIDSESEISIEKQATIAGNGTCHGTVYMADSSFVVPGGPNSTGKLSIGSLSSENATQFIFDVGIHSDTIDIINARYSIVYGVVSLNILTSIEDMAYYTLFTTNGIFGETIQSLKIGSISSGYTCRLIHTESSIIAEVSAKKIIPPPSARFSFTPTIGTAPLTVIFNNISKGSIDNNMWLFGDDKISILKDPVHLYKEPGMYTISLIVSGEGGIDTMVLVDTLQVTLPTERKDSHGFVSLSAEPLSSSSILLSLESKFSSTVDKVKLWFSKDAIDLENLSDTSHLESMIISAADTTIEIDNLDPETQYFFGLQVNDSLTWLPIDENARTICSTLPKKSVDYTLKNTIDLDTIYFDTSSGKFRVSYCIDSSTIRNNKDLEVAISYNLSQYPVEVGGSSMKIIVLSHCMDTVLEMNKLLRFDTLYYVSLWLRSPDDIWIKPTEMSRDTVRIGQPYKQIVDLFDPDVAEDTVWAFNNCVQLWKDHKFKEKSSSRQTLQVKTDSEIPSGMVVVGTPFKFVDPAPMLPFYIGFYIQSLPTPRDIMNVRVYNVIDEKLYVLHDTRIDKDNGMVYVETDNLKSTFVALIDTVPPEIALKSNDTNKPILSTKPHNDTVIINDNISNVYYQFYCGKGNEVPHLYKSDTLSNNDTELVLTVSDTSHVISSEYGLRSYCIITDGVYYDTFSLSRSVLRNESDPMTTVGGNWSPVYPTGYLQHREIDSLISRLSKIQAEKNDGSYDTKHVRVYRWIQYAGNKKSSEKWVEYNPGEADIRALFHLDPGTMLWLKTRENAPLHLDSAYTLLPGDTFTLSLPPLQWTDFGMPFRISVPLATIFEATGSTIKYIDFCQWKQDKVTSLYNLEPLYISGMSGQDSNVVLEYQSMGGHSIYNHHSETVNLRIPFILPEMIDMESTMAKIAHITKDQHRCWGVTFAAQSDLGDSLEKVYCGYAPAIAQRQYPLGPSFASLRAMLVNRLDETLEGESIGKENKDGFVKELAIRNKSDSTRTVKWLLQQCGHLPDGFYAALFNPIGTQSSNNGSISVAANSMITRFIVVGDAAFHKNFSKHAASLRYSLCAPYPNPAKSQVTIRYIIPVAANEKIRISIYSLNGRKVWDYQSKGFLRPGINKVVWNGTDMTGNRCTTGLYIIHLKTLKNNGAIIKQFKQKISLFQ